MCANDLEGITPKHAATGFTARVEGLSLGSLGIVWVAVKELKLGYHNGSM